MAQIRPEPVDSPDARLLLTEYRAEVRRRWSGLPPAGALPAEEAPADLELTAPRGGVFLLARLDGRPAGCAGVRTLDTDPADPGTPAAGTPGSAELKRLYVRPSARGHGLGRALLAAAEDAARALGHTRLRLDTMAEFAEARALYTAAGYADIPPYNTNPYAAHWLEKVL
ncbi:acetyltransferase (GNAT) family protein [Kitasatospora sp. SolWspMP-SS2h]|uniref:GNAT family N-acetyltransferase n=1 Tax=Kitasatospora sp. SolWspMP-SS2h TaxID=1305729 RepID=UPI000DBF5FFA|nr:GNAT family N-acetyltransferase [Kitasatospora sp. SolWspMP-SS2h]RAJ35828.1 acetyltransferase (GNAT) family protein [Kitasatospora sp. SolWspMP-SS2h]